jgi:anti-sigma factor RsiW
MNPDKLFDYLDGKLEPGDRQQLEEKLMSDAQLRREFQIAREIHRSGGEAREAIVVSEDPETVARAGRLGRRIATAAFALVVLNVVGGLGVIAWKQKKPAAERAQEAAVRRQLEQSLGAAGINALPTPSLSDDEVTMVAPRSEWDKLAGDVIKAAEACGGSGIRDADESRMLVTASIPRDRAADFRRQVLGPNASAPVTPASESETTTVQVRISETAR